MKPLSHNFQAIPKGMTFHYDGHKYHFVDYHLDGDEDLYIVKYYGKREQWWHYEILTCYEFYKRFWAELFKKKIIPVE